MLDDLELEAGAPGDGESSQHIATRRDEGVEQRLRHG